MLLEPALKQNPGCIVLDEFQWMANYRTAIVSDLKMVWEQYLSRIPGVALILCGSIASFMLTRVIRSSALYGRTDRTIHLHPFQLTDTARMLPALGMDELLEAQMILGGVPKYLELIRDYPSLYLALDDLAFSENGFLAHEYDRIFVSHFGRNEDFPRIIRTLAQYPYGLFRHELAQKAGIDEGGGLSRQLFDLESAGFIRAMRPLDRGPHTRSLRYLLSDPYMRFYHALLLPWRSRRTSRSPRNSFFDMAQRPAYHGWRGRAFELVCLRHAWEIAKALGFSGIQYTSGPFFRSARAGQSGVQIDLAFDRSDHVITACEMKCSRHPIGPEVIGAMEQKAAFLRQAFPRKTIQNVLIYHGALTREVEYSPLIQRKLSSACLFASTEEQP